MPPSPASRAARAAATLAITAAALGSLLAAPAPARADQGTRYCRSASHPGLAARLSHGIEQALQGDRSTLAFSVRDTATGLVCAADPDRHFDSASIVKVTVLGAVLRRAEEQHRALTGPEQQDLRLMVTQSDNDAASRLWQSLGQDFLQKFLHLAGMDRTYLSADGWGLTQVTADDEMRQLDILTGGQDVLTAEDQAYALNLMAQVEADQRWGTPYGAPATVTVHVKNGWLQRATHGWRVNSLGVFTGAGTTYRMAVLTDDNPTEAYGIDTVQRIAWQVHHALAGA